MHVPGFFYKNLFLQKIDINRNGVRGGLRINI
jgi:hypothetical protein